MDFDQQELARALESSGFDPKLPAFVIWEGVTGYLTREGIDATLRSLAKAAPGTLVIFTYLDRRVIEAPEEYEGGRRRWQRPFEASGSLGSSARARRDSSYSPPSAASPSWTTSAQTSSESGTWAPRAATPRATTSSGLRSRR